MIDPYFQVEIIDEATNPQQLIWGSALQCVCRGVSIDDPSPTEEKAGGYVIEHLLASDLEDYSPLEVAQISFSVTGFNRRTMQQVTQQGIGAHCSAQWMQHSGDRIAALGKEFEDIEGNIDLFYSPDKWEDRLLKETESLFYLRPVGTYADRAIGTYEYTKLARNVDLSRCALTSIWYCQGIEEGRSHEQCAGLLPMDVRQDWIVNTNARSLIHLLDLRSNVGTQMEYQYLCDLLWSHFEEWVPAIASWYREGQQKKARFVQ